MKLPPALILFLCLFLTACHTFATPKPESRTLTIFAAASLTDAFTEIGTAFESVNPGVTTTFNFAGSQALETQIEEGAPVDVFASASGREMDALVTGNFVAADAVQVFLTNELIVILPADNPAMLGSLEDLAKPGIKLVFASEEVPAGKYTRQALDLMDTSFGHGFKDMVLANIVSNEENVKQVVTKVQLGEADAGIVYVSDSIAGSNLNSIGIPANLNIAAKYPIAPLVKSKNAELAAQFIEFILSAEGQAVLAKWGFAPAKKF